MSTSPTHKLTNQIKALTTTSTNILLVKSKTFSLLNATNKPSTPPNTNTPSLNPTSATYLPLDKISAPFKQHAMIKHSCIKTYAMENTTAPASPSVERVTENKLTSSLLFPSAHNVAKFTSVRQNPVAMKYNHMATKTSELGTNPLGPVISGNASTPVPTVVPAIRAALPKTDPDSSSCVPTFALDRNPAFAVVF